MTSPFLAMGIAKTAHFNSEIPFATKRHQDFWRKWLNPSLGQTMYKMSLSGHTVSKQLPRTTSVVSKRLESQLEASPKVRKYPEWIETHKKSLNL